MADEVEQKTPQASGPALKSEAKKKQKERNLAIAVALVGFIVLVFVVTVVRLGVSVAG